MKALIISNLTRRFLPGHFTMIEPLQELGFEVHWASNFSEYKDNLSDAPIKTYNIDFNRNPFNINNYKAYKQLMRLVRSEKYDLIHCNSPIGGLLGRICGKKSKVSKVIYTAHGFHFYKGGSTVKNFIYRFAEERLAKLTDAIITITREDYQVAKTFRTNKRMKSFHVSGVGIDVTAIQKRSVDKDLILNSLDLNNKSFIIISAGDLNINKNNKVIIESISKIDINNIHYLICGTGVLRDELMNLSKKLKIENQVHFLGYRNDVIDLMKVSDVFVMPSLREGLSRSIMEAMACGLPCIVSEIRGNVDLIKNGINGYLVSDNDSEEFKNDIVKLYEDEEIRNSMQNKNIIESSKYDIHTISRRMREIYSEIIYK